MKLRNKKTGEIWDIGKVLTNDYPSYETLEQITEDFEDCIPPLIKDEKIRKAVRAWAEANEFASVFYEYDYSNDVARFIVGETVMIIETDEVLKYCQGYTITELCGEEEE